MFYFAYDSVFEHNESKKLKVLDETARKFNCRLHLRSLDENLYPLETPEGNIFHRYIVSTLVQEDWEAFASSVMEYIPDIQWTPLSPELWMRIIYPNGIYLSRSEEDYYEEHYINSVIESWPSVAAYNVDLKRRLAEESPLYFTYEWVMPAGEDARITWFGDLSFTVLMLSRGCELRVSGEMKLHLNTHKQTLVIRLFKLEELEALRQKIDSDSDWQGASAEIFLNAKPIIPEHYFAQIK